jgi:hypothetical protein
LEMLERMPTLMQHTFRSAPFAFPLRTPSYLHPAIKPSVSGARPPNSPQRSMPP